VAITRGCIPVLVGANIAPYYDGFLDTSAFSLRLPEAAIHAVVDFVQGVAPAQEEALRREVDKVRRRHMWTEGDPEDAFATTMAYLLKHVDWDLPAPAR
jgi:hypothetical protein